MYRLAWVILTVTACSGGNVRRIEPEVLPKCGDGVAQADEGCDGSDLKGATCVTAGFEAGTLVCGGDCRLVTTACTRRCGNGALDLLETCDGTLGVGVCGTFGLERCSSTCTLDRTGCVTTPYEAGPSLDVMKGGPSWIADLSPRGLPDLLLAVPAFGRVEVFPWIQSNGFSATSSKLLFRRDPLAVAALDDDGDGLVDVATVNDGGSVDVYRSGVTSAALRIVADAGCPGGRFLPSAADPRRVAIAGCEGDGGVWLLSGGAVRRLEIGPGAVTAGRFVGDDTLDLLVASSAGVVLVDGATGDAGVAIPFPAEFAEVAAGDLDGDGDVDVAGLDGAGVTVFENAGASFAVARSFPGAGAQHLRVHDLDGDGRLDVGFARGADWIAKRNVGGFTFTEFRAPLGTGPRLSLHVADVDGDGDADVAVTVATGAESTRTDVLLNRVR